VITYLRYKGLVCQAILLTFSPSVLILFMVMMMLEFKSDFSKAIADRV